MAGATVNSILRAFNSLSAAEAGSTNASHLNTADLALGNFQLNWPCYNDGFLTDSVSVSGYTTGPSNYIRIFTPVSSAEVGASQRHRGVFGTGFRMGSTNAFTIQILDAYVRVEGLTIQLTSTAAGSGREGIVSQPAGVSDVRISHNIIKGVISGNNNADPTGILVGANDANVHRISNNIVYGFHDNLQDQFGIQHNDGDAYIFSNTVFNCATGFVRSSGSLNNLNGMRSNVSINFALNAAYKDYSFTDGVNSYNVSSDATATTYACTGCQINKTAYASYFTSTIPGDEDFHLRTTSLNLWGSNGANLFANPNLAVTDDIDGAARVRPDIGADEFGPAPGPQMLVLSGTYVGNGALSGRSIYVGFQPDLVIVSSDSTNAGVGASYPTGHTAVLRSSSMSGNLSVAAYVYAHTPLANRITSLDPTGFTVGHPPDHAVPNDEPTDPYHCVNHTGVGYYWTAFKAAPGQMVAGSYLGNGAVTQDITTVGFSPDYVIVMPSSGESPVQRFAAMPVDYSFDFDGGSQCPAGCPRSPGIRTELANGFRVGTYVNTNSVPYHYVAWNQTPGRIAVGSYMGNSPTDNRSITGTGFRPEFVTISNGQTPVPNTSTTFKSASTGVSTDYSLVYVAYTSAYQGPDAIQKLEVDGFQIGQSNNVNSAGEPHYWAAFGPHRAGVNLRSIGPAANYGTGTVQATTGSTQVLGTGTAWRTANRGRGDRMQITGSSIGDYTVASVVSDTELRPHGSIRGHGRCLEDLLAAAEVRAGLAVGGLRQRAAPGGVRDARGGRDARVEHEPRDRRPERGRDPVQRRRARRRQPDRALRAAGRQPADRVDQRHDHRRQPHRHADRGPWQPPRGRWLERRWGDAARGLRLRRRHGQPDPRGSRLRDARVDRLARGEPARDQPERRDHAIERLRAVHDRPAQQHRPRRRHGVRHRRHLARGRHLQQRRLQLRPGHAQRSRPEHRPVTDPHLQQHCLGLHGRLPRGAQRERSRAAAQQPGGGHDR